MNHTLILKWQAEKAMTVKQGCELFAISRAGYYAAQRRKLKPQPLCLIKVQLKSHFEASERSYGSRRLLVDLNNKGIRIGAIKQMPTFCYEKVRAEAAVICCTLAE